jgi:hypothetical protein
MNDYQRFWPFDRKVGKAVVVFGIAIGLIAASLAYSWLSAMLLLLAAHAVGGVAIMMIEKAFRLFFPGGVPDLPVLDPDMTSPDNFGKMARRHFARFAKAMMWAFAAGLTLRVFFRLV